jgi:hypothetical protein
MESQLNIRSPVSSHLQLEKAWSAPSVLWKSLLSVTTATNRASTGKISTTMKLGLFMISADWGMEILSSLWKTSRVLNPDWRRNRIIESDVSILLGEERRIVNAKNEPSNIFCPEQCANFLHSLPTALEHLTIWKCTVSIIECLQELFPCEGHVLPPNFKLLTLFFRALSASLSDLEMEEWEEQALMVGVVLKWERTSPSDLEMEEWEEQALMVGVVLKWERTSTGRPVDQ